MGIRVFFSPCGPIQCHHMFLRLPFPMLLLLRLFCLLRYEDFFFFSKDSQFRQFPLLSVVDVIDVISRAMDKALSTMMIALCMFSLLRPTFPLDDLVLLLSPRLSSGSRSSRRPEAAALHLQGIFWQTIATTTILMMSDCQHLELSKKISAKCILGLFAVCMITTNHQNTERILDV